MPSNSSLVLMNIFDFIGIIAFSFSGVLAAHGKRIDPFGVFVLAFLTAFGGGIIRDLIINRYPLYWVTHEYYVWMTLGIALTAPFLLRQYLKLKHRAKVTFIWMDTIGLAAFAIGSTAFCLEMGMPYLVSVLLGVCTGVVGGLFRDICLNQVPLVLSDGEPYASSAFLGGWIYVGLHQIDTPYELDLLISMILIIAIRMYCWHNHLRPIRFWHQTPDDVLGPISYSKDTRHPQPTDPMDTNQSQPSSSINQNDKSNPANS